MSVGTKKMHWISALLTALRLRKTGGLVENEVLEALKISLHPPSLPAAASPDLINRIRFFMSGEDRPMLRKEDIEYTRTTSQSPIAAGLRNCEFLLQKYENIHDPRDTGGYFVNEGHYLTSPPMKRRGRLYCVQIVTGFTIQYTYGLPYRTCVIAQPRHPGDMRLSGLEVISLLLLAIESYENAPNERFHTVRVFAVDSFLVRRLSARIPSAYICTLIQSVKKAAPEEPVGEITLEQTSYFDLSNDQELESILAVLFEDEAKRMKEPESAPDPNLDPIWRKL
ncbi:hypothetical protein MMC22_005146 [Lobaria immixta]|nr:hypothetical protein [Lobaria immixta]